MKKTYIDWDFKKGTQGKEQSYRETGGKGWRNLPENGKEGEKKNKAESLHQECH